MAKAAAGSREQRAEIADAAVGERDHLLEPRLVAAGEGAQPAPEVVVQDQRPASEQLLGEELGEHAVALRPGVHAEQVVGVAVQHERRGRAGEEQVGDLVGPRRDPRREVGWPARLLQPQAWSRSAPRRSVSMIGGGSSS